MSSLKTSLSIMFTLLSVVVVFTLFSASCGGTQRVSDQDRKTIKENRSDMDKDLDSAVKKKEADKE